MDYIIFSGILVGLIQVIKVTTGLNSRFIPICAILLSFAILFLYSFIEKSPFTWSVIENGFITALSAVGLWSGTKATLGK